MQGMDASSEPLSPFASYIGDQEKEKQRVASGASAGAPSAPKAIPGAKEGKPPKAPTDNGSTADAGSASPLADTPTSGDERCASRNALARLAGAAIATVTSLPGRQLPVPSMCWRTAEPPCQQTLLMAASPCQGCRDSMLRKRCACRLVLV